MHIDGSSMATDVYGTLLTWSNEDAFYIGETACIEVATRTQVGNAAYPPVAWWDMVEDETSLSVRLNFHAALHPGRGRVLVVDVARIELNVCACDGLAAAAYGAAQTRPWLK